MHWKLHMLWEVKIGDHKSCVGFEEPNVWELKKGWIIKFVCEFRMMYALQIHQVIEAWVEFYK